LYSFPPAPRVRREKEEREERNPSEGRYSTWALGESSGEDDVGHTSLEENDVLIIHIPDDVIQPAPNLLGIPKSPSFSVFLSLSPEK
jgi:hypothetical protein